MKRHEHLSWYFLASCAALAASACGDEVDTAPDAGAPDAMAGPTATLVARAILPAATFAEGPPAGAHLGQDVINGQSVPFASQPVQGFSGLVALDDQGGAGDGFLALSDNGFGSLENSADYHLRVYHIQPDLGAPSSTIDGVIGYWDLRDPNNLIPFTITNEFTAERILTGADFDVESIQIAPDGTWWLGDEFGPFLLHFSADGVLLDAPIALPDAGNPGQDIRSPQSPLNEEASAVRIMNAVRAHARLHGSSKTPVFSPYNVMLKYEGSDPNAHYARGDSTPAGLTEAASDVFDIASIQAAGYPIVTWTVNDEARMSELLAQGVDGIISDRPDLLYAAVSAFDADGDGTPGDYLDADGLIDPAKFDAQGHRGARNLRPENTLPAMEAALDNLMGTLETDAGLTSDNVPVLNHDPYINPSKCRRADGTDYTEAHQVLVKDLTAADIQAQFLCDKVFRGDPQTNDITQSPVSVIFAEDNSIAPYAMPTLEQLLDFVDFYVDYYRNDAGSIHPDAAKRAANAERVRFNIETKLNPRSDQDSHGNVHKDRTAGPDAFADAIAGIIIARDLSARADIQSFDFRTLLRVQETQPDIRTVYLFGDFPIFAGAGSDDGTNLQDEGGANTPWLGGLVWPYRVTARTRPFRLGRSGGFEGMALSADGTKLLPLLEKPLDGQGSELLIHEFDIASEQFTGVRYRYPLANADHAIGDFIMVDEQAGLVIERDNTQGRTDAFKTIQRITLQGDGELVDKALLVDLTAIADPQNIAIAQEGDVGVGNGTFALPFVTIESVIVLGADRIAVANDNNFPFSVGRHVGSGAPDDTEIVVLELSTPLSAL